MQRVNRQAFYWRKAILGDRRADPSRGRRLKVDFPVDADSGLIDSNVAMVNV